MDVLRSRGQISSQCAELHWGGIRPHNRVADALRRLNREWRRQAGSPIACGFSATTSCDERPPVPLACASPLYGNKTGRGVNFLVNEHEPNFFQKDFLCAECPAHQ